MSEQRNTRYVATLNEEELDQQVNRAADRARRSFSSIATAARQTAQIGISMAQAFGFAIDQSLALGIEAALITIETIATIDAAIASATLGATLPRILLQSAAIGSLIATIALLKRGQTEAATRMRFVVQTFRAMTFRSYIVLLSLYLELIT